MPGSSARAVPDDWYRFAYPPEMVKLPWAQKTGWEVDRLTMMLSESAVTSQSHLNRNPPGTI